jgi:hypothetical protein
VRTQRRHCVGWQSTSTRSGNPRTGATVEQLLDRHFVLLEVEPSTLTTYRSLPASHVVPLIGKQKVGALRAQQPPDQSIRVRDEELGYSQRANARTRKVDMPAAAAKCRNR